MTAGCLPNEALVTGALGFDEVICVDLPGHGQSAFPRKIRDWHPGYFAQAVRACVEDRGWGDATGLAV